MTKPAMLKRTVDVPKTEAVEFVRHAKIVARPAVGGTGLALQLLDEPGRLAYGRRCLVSADAAGDHMRGAPMICQGYLGQAGAPEIAIFTGQTGTETEGDWLWTEAPLAQESLTEALRRQAQLPTAPHSWGGLVGGLVGGGRHQ